VTILLLIYNIKRAITVLGFKILLKNRIKNGKFACFVQFMLSLS